MVENDRVNVAVACQGGGSHTAFTAGALKEMLLNSPSRYKVQALSGTSGGGICAALVWDGLRRSSTEGAVDRLEGFWSDIAANSYWEKFTNNLSVWNGRLTGELGSFGLSPYSHPVSIFGKQQLRNIIEKYIEFDDSIDKSPPHLFIGAVSVESGSFKVFTNGEDGVSGLLASAAIPNIFRAVDINDIKYWDGLFSQNPPIRHFMTDVSIDQKPDEIWIIRINPEKRDRTPRSMGEIMDRRNELSGNLSLKQEKDMIESINDLIDENIISHERYKHIEIHEIELDRKLDIHSKLDRNPRFIQELKNLGAKKADGFWNK